MRRSRSARFATGSWSPESPQRPALARWKLQVERELLAFAPVLDPLFDSPFAERRLVCVLGRGLAAARIDLDEQTPGRIAMLTGCNPRCVDGLPMCWLEVVRGQFKFE